MESKGMAITAIESKGGGVTLAGALLVSGIRNANKPGSSIGHYRQHRGLRKKKLNSYFNWYLYYRQK